MSTEFRLVPLSCPSCGAALAAEGTDCVFYCTACHSGYLFDGAVQETGHGERVIARPVAGALAPLEVSFVAAPHVQVERYLPFWLLPAELEILERSGSGIGGAISGLLSIFTGAPEAAGGGQATFAVPAVETPLERAAALTGRFTAQLPGLGERLGERLVGGSVTPADAAKLAEYALIAQEVAKGDTLKDFRYRLGFGEPRLLGVPFVRGRNGPVDAFFGLPV